MRNFRKKFVFYDKGIDITGEFGWRVLNGQFFKENGFLSNKKSS